MGRCVEARIQEILDSTIQRTYINRYKSDMYWVRIRNMKSYKLMIALK